MALVHDQIPTGALRVYKRESDGAWLAEGDTNREGIYLYDENGRTIRELRTADTVRRMTSAVARSVVTMGHPDVEITPDNVANLAHGDVDGGFDIVDQGGFVRGRNRVALRTAAAIAAAERGDLKGFSPGHTPIRDNTPGTDPKWGAYDRILVDVAGVNHLALCGDSDALPPARGGNDVCALYLDSLPRSSGSNPMKFKTKAERDAALKTDAAKALIGRVFAKDAPSLEELAAIVQEAVADPESLAALVVHAIVNKPAEVAEIRAGEEPMDGDMPPAMAAQMDALIKAATGPLRAELDALKADKSARDNATRLAAEGAFRANAVGLGIKDAATVAIADLVKTAASRLALSIDGLPAEHALSVVAQTAALRAADSGTALPILETDANESPYYVGPAIAAPKRS